MPTKNMQLVMLLSKQFNVQCDDERVSMTFLPRHEVQVQREGNMPTNYDLEEAIETELFITCCMWCGKSDGHLLYDEKLDALIHPDCREAMKRQYERETVKGG